MLKYNKILVSNTQYLTTVFPSSLTASRPSSDRVFSSKAFWRSLSRCSHRENKYLIFCAIVGTMREYLSSSDSIFFIVWKHNFRVSTSVVVQIWFSLDDMVARIYAMPSIETWADAGLLSSVWVSSTLDGVGALLLPRDAIRRTTCTSSWSLVDGGGRRNWVFLHRRYGLVHR